MRSKVDSQEDDPKKVKAGLRFLRRALTEEQVANIGGEYFRPDILRSWKLRFLASA